MADNQSKEKMNLSKKHLIRFNQILFETHTYVCFSKKDRKNVHEINNNNNTRLFFRKR